MSHRNSIAFCPRLNLLRTSNFMRKLSSCPCIDIRETWTGDIARWTMCDLILSIGFIEPPPPDIAETLPSSLRFSCPVLVRIFSCVSAVNAAFIGTVPEDRLGTYSSHPLALTPLGFSFLHEPLTRTSIITIVYGWALRCLSQGDVDLIFCETAHRWRRSAE